MTLNCQGNLIDLQTPRVMAILNLTPDSFYDGGQFNEKHTAQKQTEKMLEAGACFIDVGAASSRPGATQLSAEEESQRLFPILDALLKSFPDALFSVDTYHSSVAEKALDKGVAMINDISGGQHDSKMYQTIGRFDAPYVCMHMQGSPQNMQNNPQYKAIVEEQLLFFAQKVKTIQAAGIHDVIIDPGFGFGKTTAHNFEILKGLSHFHRLNMPIMVGVSRKSMIYKTLDITPQEALNGTTALHMYALQKGAHLLRVHDVKEAVQTIDLLQALN